MKQGFTLIEILVAVSIISVLSGGSLVGYNRFQGRQGVRAAGDQLQVDLRLTQQKALSGEKPAGWCSGTGDQLFGWRLEFIDASRYEIKGVCSDATTVVDKTIILANSVTKSAGDAMVDFEAVTGSATSDASFLLRRGLAGGNVETTVSVTSAGSVQSSSLTSTSLTPAPTWSPPSPTPTQTPPLPTPIPTLTPIPTNTPTPIPTPTPTIIQQQQQYQQPTAPPYRSPTTPPYYRQPTPTPAGSCRVRFRGRCIF